MPAEIPPYSGPAGLFQLRLAHQQLSQVRQQLVRIDGAIAPLASAVGAARPLTTAAQQAMVNLQQARWWLEVEQKSWDHHYRQIENARIERGESCDLAEPPARPQNPKPAPDAKK